MVGSTDSEITEKESLQIHHSAYRFTRNSSSSLPHWVMPLQVVTAATSVAASTFRLYDRGAIAIGLRAHLVLLSANPLVDVANTLKITKVFLAGVEFDP